MKDTLTPRQLAFVLEYIKDGNGARSYVAAGYSPNGAKQSAEQLLRRPHIRAEIDRRSAAIAERLEINAETTRRELGLIAHSDVGKFYREDGTFKPIHEITPDDRRAIARHRSTVCESLRLHRGFEPTRSTGSESFLLRQGL
jgi:hypothetical protein